MAASGIGNGRSPGPRRVDHTSEQRRSNEPGDLLNGVGSSSSLTSNASSVFSANAQSHKANGRPLAGAATPLTISESSPANVQSPKPSVTAGRPYLNGSLSRHPTPTASRVTSASATPLASPARDRKQARPPPGEVKGYRAIWDPELDGKLGKEEKRKMKPKVKTFGSETYEPDAPPDPRLAIVGYLVGKCTPPNATSKSRLRTAPYMLKPYPHDSKASVGPGPPKQVVVTGFDPFTPDSQLKTFFSSYGEVAEVQNQTDPDTASFLGICLIRYRDSRPVRGSTIYAAAAARRAEKEGTGERFGLRTIRVECDREGRKCKRYVERILKKAQAEQEAERARLRPPPVLSKEPLPVSTSTPHPTESPAPPVNAPKGPSGRTTTKPPEGPKAIIQKTGAHSLIEEEPVLSKIKRKPYILLPASSVPVLGTTIPHLKKRLKAFDWKEVRLDQTGYYVIFDDSKRGEDETVRCFNECNNTPLFTYTMGMECQQYGNPDYERSPSPERVMAENRKKEEIERLQREEDEDVQIEKQHRAEALDPVKGALDQLAIELRMKIMDDIKLRVAIPSLYECLDPTRHAAKRRKLGLSDALDNENKAPSVLLNKALDAAPGSPRGRRPLSHSKPLRPHDPNSQRRPLNNNNAYLDERRRHRPAPKAAPARPLHFRLQDMFRDDEDDSDDERRTSITRDTEDLESRPMSRASSTPFESETNDTPKHKKRKTDHVIWDIEDEQEVFLPHYKTLLGDVLGKRTEDMAVGELQHIINVLSSHKPDSTLLDRAKTELSYRKRLKFDDDLFKTGGTPTGQSTPIPDSAKAGPLGDIEAVDSKDVAIKKEKVKKKRKTKKELAQEREELERQVKEAAESAIKDETITEQLEEKAERIVYEEEIEEDYIDADLGSKVEWGVSTDEPRRTVEDEDDLVLDIDGWQHLIKDQEDLTLLTKAMNAASINPAPITDVKLWTWKQKEIKTLNNGGVSGPVNIETHISGYYVPNPTGSARTEGIKKILNSEKSKYLPHRIRVQKAREEREALAKSDPTGLAEAAKQAAAAAAKVTATAQSRSARANNRRMVNDINLQKQGGPTSGAETDVFRFNQLKKRKKLVKFDRSAIHGWGLYSEENIPAGDLIIEYVGEKVRQKVADMREEMYDRQGVGSSYLFRMVDDEIIDATKKGGIARFINHSCTPNCTAKIIKVEGTRRIVIYALKDVVKNDELTYDYKFEREYGSTDRIPCLCGSIGCKGFLN